MGDFEAWLQDVAPPDVRQTITWLEANGFTRSSVRGGREESFGNAVIRFEGPDVDAEIVRDRGQWMFDFVIQETRRALDVVSHVRNGRRQWAIRQGDLRESLPTQLPEDVRWKEEVPLCLDWLLGHPNAGETLDAAARQRGVELFGS